MSETLYRKYRPLTFAEVTDQNHVKVTLQNQLKTGTVAHAYLFSGPRGVGKTTLARILAKAVNCEKSTEGEPCNSCSSCLAIAQGKTMDIFEIDAASNTGVDHVRENIIDAVRFRPSQLKKKVFIIDEVHGLSTAAFNALLKTLEEPPEHVLFIMATTELHKLPETVISRCQRFDFHRLHEKDIVERLQNIAKAEKVKVEEDVLLSIAKHSDGCLHDAESLFGQIIAICDNDVIRMDEASLILPVAHVKIISTFLDALSRKSGEEAIAIIQNAVEEGIRIEPFEQELIDTLRMQMVNQLKQAPVEFAFSVQEARELLEHLLEYVAQYKNERIPELPLELLTIRWCEGSATKPAAISIPENPVVPTKQIAPPLKQKSEESLTLAKPSTASIIKTSLEGIQSKWKACCELAKEQSGTLPVMMQNAKLLRLEGSLLSIGVNVRFLADQLNESRNRTLLDKVLQEVFQEQIQVKAEYTEEETDELVSGLLESFGGKVMQT